MMWTILISIMIVSEKPGFAKPPVAVAAQTVGLFKTAAECEVVAEANRSKSNLDSYVPYYAARCIRIQ